MKKSTFIQTHRNGVYFRVFGYGLSVDFNSEPVFSERIGKTKKLIRIGKLSMELLKP